MLAGLGHVRFDDGLLENGRASGIHDHELFGTGR
jgi:hypothetical protein